jgi:hypothetical protein
VLPWVEADDIEPAAEAHAREEHIQPCERERWLHIAVAGPDAQDEEVKRFPLHLSRGPHAAECHITNVHTTTEAMLTEGPIMLSAGHAQGEGWGARAL